MSGGRCSRCGQGKGCQEGLSWDGMPSQWQPGSNMAYVEKRGKRLSARGITLLTAQVGQSLRRHHTGAWSEGALAARTSRSITQVSSRSAACGDSNRWSIRSP